MPRLGDGVKLVGSCIFHSVGAKTVSSPSSYPQGVSNTLNSENFLPSFRCRDSLAEFDQYAGYSFHVEVQLQAFLEKKLE